MLLSLFCLSSMGQIWEPYYLKKVSFQIAENNFLQFSTEEMAKVVLNLKFSKGLRKMYFLNLLRYECCDNCKNCQLE